CRSSFRNARISPSLLSSLCWVRLSVRNFRIVRARLIAALIAAAIARRKQLGLNTQSVFLRIGRHRKGLERDVETALVIGPASADPRPVGLAVLALAGRAEVVGLGHAAIL